MSEFLERKEVDWELASCRGIDTEMFFKQQSELLAEGLSFYNLRQVCFNCPIWKDCLKIASQTERYGFWGGVSEEERQQIWRRKGKRRHAALVRDLQYFPQVRIQEIEEIILNADRDFGTSFKNNL